MQHKDLSLVLSSDAKPRLKWTPELHQRFIDAVTQLGGPDKATPKSLMRMMDIHGLTLYHLKSHLQKYRLGKSQQSQTCNDNEQEDHKEDPRSHLSRDISDGMRNPIKESLQIAQALQMQMEVQRNLQEQLEVQRHLQLRIEAQGKYLQSVLMKAQETLSGYNSSSAELELAKAELSQLVSMVDSGCPSSSLSVLTDIGGPTLKDTKKNPLSGSGCSLESSLTSTESSGTKEEIRRIPQIDDTKKLNRNPVVLPLMEMHPAGDESISSSQVTGRKRRENTISDANCVSVKRSPAHVENSTDDQLKKFALLETLDLNSQYLNDLNQSPKPVDLNCKGLENLNGHF